MKTTSLTTGVVLLLCSSPPALAQTERELDAHEHGAATLDVALDGSRLYLDLRTPADNVLGFEHAPSTPEQRAALEAARAVLESAAPFTPDPAAGCSLEEVTVSLDLPGEDAHDEEDHADDDHADEAHADEGHADEGHADEGHADDTHAEEGHADEGHADEGHADAEHSGEEHAGDERVGGAVHSDIRTGHVFACERPERLARVGTTLFDAFTGFEEIEVQLVGPGGQSAFELNPDRTLIELEPVR